MPNDHDCCDQCKGANVNCPACDGESYMAHEHDEVLNQRHDLYLYPCADCGDAKNIEIVTVVRKHATTYEAGCDYCGAYGDEGKTVAAALKNWDKYRKADGAFWRKQYGHAPHGQQRQEEEAQQ